MNYEMENFTHADWKFYESNYLHQSVFNFQGFAVICH